MTEAIRQVTVLMAEHDPDDRLLVGEAFRELRIERHLRFVDSSEQLLDYLHRRGEFSDDACFPWPDLILMYINMPGKDGEEALREIKSNPELRAVPVVVFSESTAQDDVATCYALGCNSYIVKPMSFERLAKIVKLLDAYWLGVVEPVHHP